MIFLLVIGVLKLPVLIRAVATFFLFRYINSCFVSFFSCRKSLIVSNLLLWIEFDRCRIELNLVEKRFHIIGITFKKRLTITKNLQC